MIFEVPFNPEAVGRSSGRGRVVGVSLCGPAQPSQLAAEKSARFPSHCRVLTRVLDTLVSLVLFDLVRFSKLRLLLRSLPLCLLFVKTIC